MNTTLTSRILAGSTVAGALLLGYASGVFGTFSTTILSGQSCSGYGYFAGYGYGYDCNVSAGGGGGGGGSAGLSTPLVSVPTASGITLAPPAPIVSTIIATDIAKSPYKSAIEMLIRKGVMNNALNVRPSQSITRAEFLKLLSIANGYTPVVVTKKFGDLPSTHTLASYVNFGVSKGWVNIRNKNFRPNDTITQGEIDKLINAIQGSATADTVAAPSSGVTRGKAASDIVKAFY